MIYTTAIHGDETVPVFTLASLGIDQLVCNTKALIKNKRFIEKDLNKSFQTKGNTIEEIRAAEILKLIPKSETVVDFHTTSAKTEPFAIVVDLKMVPLVASTGLKHVVYMKHNIKSGHSLIDHRKGISVEVGRHNDLSSFETTQTVCKNINSKKLHNFTLYEVTDVIKNKGIYKNFKMHKDGFVPILAGEKAYDILGLKAKIIKI